MIDFIKDLDFQSGQVLIKVSALFECGELSSTVMFDLVCMMRKLAERTDNTIDDALVDLIEQALEPVPPAA